MPTYEYRCPNDHAFEVFQKMSDEPVATCPECGAEAERILSGGAGFLFKGEGFYITDYRSEEYKKKAEAESGEKAGKAGKTGEAAKAGEAGEGGGEKKGDAAKAAGGGSGSGSSGEKKKKKKKAEG